MHCSHHSNVFQACALVLAWVTSFRLLLVALSSLCVSGSLATLLYVMAIATSALQTISSMWFTAFVLIHETLKTCHRAHILELIFGTFPIPPFLPIGIGARLSP